MQYTSLASWAAPSYPKRTERVAECMSTMHSGTCTNTLTATERQRRITATVNHQAGLVRCARGWAAPRPPSTPPSTSMSTGHERTNRSGRNVHALTAQLPRRIPPPEGALQLPLSTRAPRAEALLGYGRGDTLRLVKRLCRRSTTGRGQPGPQFHVYLLIVCLSICLCCVCVVFVCVFVSVYSGLQQSKDPN